MNLKVVLIRDLTYFRFVSVQSSDTSPAVSKLTVNLGSSKQQASPAKTASPYKSPANTASPYKSPANTASPYQSLASSPYSSPVGSPVVAVQVTSTKKSEYSYLANYNKEMSIN